MTADRYSTLATQGAWVNLSTRAKWRLSGADRVRYLNGQVTNDVRTANSLTALYACVTNLKGKIEGDIFIHAAPDGESLLLDADTSLRESLGIRLERYIIADDAVLEDITDDWQLWHRISPPNGTENPPSAEGHYLTNEYRFHLPGYDVWLPNTSAPPSETWLSEAEAETLRILNRVPAYPHELNAETFPQEAGLESRAMSFTKGCYIGQEILSRIKTTGKMPRQLIAWTSETEQPHGEFLMNAEGKEVGQITSATWHPEKQTYVGLAYVRQAAADAGTWQTFSGQTVQAV
ncbi:CAF17-like 4Fe-4S cluster assembly/insertion protein YgfZ [Prosthecobacter dejongeii]|uniref:Folate-binding protein YgfZ n=1 Tax=Prosthecobacter dejongeii TaxID=48465 RepID=A0A7W7YPS8_9BACT|nr:glycine cleavage T C-terminal barrel domain-containing protein [Prosthecobacter dejongeii]MBB5040126.1 folate-binding protein YgfZ [Prosthecobacter dejongeii]